MAYEVYQDIKIGEFRFSRSNSVEVRKSTATIGASATIKVPISAVIENNGEKGGLVETSKAIKEGDPVSINLGYRNKEKEYEKIEFAGYVRRINPVIPLEIECEDSIYLLRKKNINKSWRSVDIQDVLEEIVSGTGIVMSGSIPKVRLEPFYLQNVDGAFALQKIADEYGLTIFFKEDGSLYAGLAYTEITGESTLVLNGDNTNVINADNLKFRKAEDVKLKVKAISIRGDNTRIEAELGDEDGALRTLNFYNINTIGELEAMAKQEIEKYKFDGYEGGLETFLIPFIDPGFKVNVIDPFFPEREGSYYVESTVVTLGSGGIRRKIELSIKI